MCPTPQGDNYWVIDTDYDNYAITYACRVLKEDGTCDDGYAVVFSRNPRGLPPAIQRLIRRKQEEICWSGQFQPVLQSGEQTKNTHTNTTLDTDKRGDCLTLSHDGQILLVTGLFLLN